MRKHRRRCRCGFKTTDRRKFVEHLELDDRAKPLEERHWPVTEEMWQALQEGKAND